MSVVHIGYFENFKSSNTLLLEGDNEGFAHLLTTLRSLAQGALDEIQIHQLPFVQLHHQVQLVAHRLNKDVGVSKNGMRFDWYRTDEGWEETADKIEAVQQGGGHHYLDAENDEVTVMVSKEEYGTEFWARYG